jgi:hypothetical protein
MKLIFKEKRIKKPLYAQVCDLFGRVLKEEISYKNDFKITIADMLPGNYLIKLYNGYDQELQVEKFIKY